MEKVPCFPFSAPWAILVPSADEHTQRRCVPTNIGKEILRIRKEQSLTQEEFGELFHVTRQTVSNWENGKNYPDLQTLVELSQRFGISLDTILKGEEKMVKTIDRERLLGRFHRSSQIISVLSGCGTGMLLSCLWSPDSIRKTIVIIVSLVMIFISWYKKSQQDKAMTWYLAPENGPEA